MYTRARLAALAGSLLFLADLFFGWHRTVIQLAGAAGLEATASGWHGWGVLAGAFAVALAGVLTAELFAQTDHGIAAILAASGMLVATTLAVLAGTAEIQIGQAVDIEVQAVLWPAWTGLALAAASWVAVVWTRVDLSSRRPSHRREHPHADAA